jgi:hypothetical protein
VVVALNGTLTVAVQMVMADQEAVVKDHTLFLVEQPQELPTLEAVVEQRKVVDRELLLFLIHLRKDFWVEL